MQSDKIEVRVNEILIQLLNINVTDTNLTIKQSDHKEWDSLKHISIIADLEEEFDIMFDPEEIVVINSSDKIIDLILNKL
jgi:acyl carrier protein